ncbi:MAG TPA: hypothetical protein IGS53_20815 [Leptolyngbyaceae cyanobacterium M33_DOE_097]|uniref:Uncharacterized protein n=1 Tax=Oscillatoriales cyanobacterium SpSt-418 TaxID=2282169 RepID=A0A7C3PPY2_9CYAN|nr:hypothetical protein [Leptolyngbyaceae cyanobacterium M33_DOE_097]
MSLDQLQPAPNQQVGVYMPYYPQAAKKQLLPFAISLYQKGVLEGQRKIEGGASIPFIATWNVSTLPSEITRCRLQFDGNADLSYELMMANFEFIDFLIEVIFNFKRTKLPDFSQNFYRKLMRYDD